MLHKAQIEDLSKIIELQQSVATSRLPLYQLMTLVCHKTQELTGATGAVVELIENEDMVYKACTGTLEQSIGVRLSRHSSLSGLSAKMAEVLYCKDSEEDSRVNRDACRKVGARSMICVPLIFEKPVGVLKVVSPLALKFSDRDINVLRLLAGLLSAVISQAESDFQKEAAFQLLSESENKFKTLVEAAHDGIILSKKGFCFDMNPSFCKLTGYSREEIINKPIVDFFIPEERSRIKEIVKTGYSDIYQANCLKKDGSIFIAEVIGKHLLINNEEIRMATVKDITKIKEAEDVLRESVVKTQQAIKNKSEFLANMSHEIRTPLNGIAGMSDLLKETPLSKEQKRYVKIINDSADNLLILVNGILDFSKLEAQKMSLEKIDFKLKTLLEDVINLLEPMAKSKKIDLSFELDPTLPEFVVGDITRIRQVLLNFSNNAIKFTDKGSVGIKIIKINEQIQFEVKDTGIGISPSAIKGMFQPFSQADTSITRRFGGTGLGLTISKQLIELMKGTLSVESAEGIGTSFIFTLKLINGNGKIVEHKNTNSQAVIEKLEKLNLKILIVDDFDDNRQLVLAYLKNFPFNIVIAENGLIALEKMKDERFDLVLMDMQMPVMDGLTATSHYRAWEKINLKTRMPIAALSAHALVEEMEKSIEAGCDAHITKPIKKLMLLNCILEMVSNK